MESAFKINYDEEELIKFNDVGMDSLLRAAKSNQLSSEDIHTYTKTLIDNRLYILPGTMRSDEKLFIKDLEESILEILYYSKTMYDFIFIDAGSSLNEVTDKILKAADIVVVNISQNVKVLEDFFSKRNWNENLNHKKIIPVIGAYDRESIFTAKYIKRIFGYKEDIYIVPYCTELLDVHNNSNLLQFMYCNSSISDKKDSMYYFSKEINKLCQGILKAAGDDKYIKNTVSFGGSFFRFLRR